jgi:hypothetical protein
MLKRFTGTAAIMGGGARKITGETMRDISSESLDRQLGVYETLAKRTNSHSSKDAATSGGNWRRFAAATGATLASAVSADAAITHVTPKSPIRVDVPDEQGVDFGPFDMLGSPADDGQLGFNASYSTYFNGWRYLGSLQGLGGVQFHGDPANGINIRQFAENEPIPAVEPTAVGAIIRSSVSTYYFGVPESLANGNWGKVETGFAGFVFGAEGQKKAGWIQIRTVPGSNGVEPRLGAIEVLQWAYENTVGASILTGQTSSGGVLGDYNGNGTVGPEDYTVWKNTFNNNVTSGTGADGNSNGRVDAADYTVWRDRLAGSGAAFAVPEPGTISLGVLALGAAGIAALRRRVSQSNTP